MAIYRYDDGVYHASSVAWVTKAASRFLNAVFSFYPEYRKNKGQIIEKITKFILFFSQSVNQVLLGKQNSRSEWYKILAMYYTKWCPDERSRSLYAPTYCMNANLKLE